MRNARACARNDRTRIATSTAVRRVVKRSNVAVLYRRRNIDCFCDFGAYRTCTLQYIQGFAFNRKKGLISRSLGEVDKRQMCFSLSDKGMETLMRIKREEIKIPEFLAPLF